MFDTTKALRLADLLESEARTAPKKTVVFSLGMWVASRVRSHWAVSDDDTEYAIDCGTQVCAIGLAIVSGQFPGLHFRDSAPVYREYKNWDAVIAYFGLDNVGQAYYLFQEDFYIQDQRRGPVGMRAVATRIRQVIGEGFPREIIPAYCGYENDVRD